jgi:hypothetical protein
MAGSGSRLQQRLEGQALEASAATEDSEATGEWQSAEQRPSVDMDMAVHV